CDVFPFTRRVTLRALIWYSVLHVYGHMGTPTRRWNALSVLSGALGEPSRAPLKFLSVRHDVLYSYGYPLAVIGPLRHHFRTTSFPESHISGPCVFCFIPYISQYRHI